jgi:hypothetical protein
MPLRPSCPIELFEQLPARDAEAADRLLLVEALE